MDNRSVSGLGVAIPKQKGKIVKRTEYGDGVEIDITTLAVPDATSGSAATGPDSGSGSSNTS